MVVVGSGFGASAVACRLAQAGRSVLVLERGRSYPPGSFPRSPRGLARNLWDPSAGLYGMFDVWAFRGIESVVSSGLGGGSLIYANVMLRKDPAWFVDDAPGQPPRPWPVTYADLEPHYEAAEAMLGAQRYPFDLAPYSATAKTRATRYAADVLGLDWQLPTAGGQLRQPGPAARSRPAPRRGAPQPARRYRGAPAGCAASATSAATTGPRTRSTTPTCPVPRTPARRSAPCARCGGSSRRGSRRLPGRLRPPRSGRARVPPAGRPSSPRTGWSSGPARSVRRTCCCAIGPRSLPSARPSAPGSRATATC